MDPTLIVIGASPNKPQLYHILKSWVVFTCSEISELKFSSFEISGNFIEISVVQNLKFPEISTFFPGNGQKNLISRGYPWGGPGGCKYPVFSQFFNSSYEIIS